MSKQRNYRHWLGWVLVLTLAGGGFALAAPAVYDQVWGNRVDARLCAVEAANGIVSPECTTTTSSTTTSSTTTSTSTTTTSTSTTSTTQPTTTTTTQPTTTTTLATTTTTAASGANLTGNVCTTVTGTATLVGNVNLTCDLMVTGLLRARPGVNVTGNGFQIMFMSGGRADFQGTPPTGGVWSNDGLTQNRVRDINFTNISRMMFHEGAGVSTLKYFTILNAGRQSQVGFYPLHFHLNGNTTRGTLVEGVVIGNSQNRAFVPHGSHGITFRDTIAFNTRGPAYWWDPGFAPNASNDILFDHALSDGSIGETPSDRGYRLAAFTLRDGTNITVRNSVARNVNPLSDKDCAGFQWPEDAESAWVFEDNASFSTNCGNGIFVWQNEGPVHIVERFRTNGVINHGAYNNKYDYRNITANGFEAHAIGWRMSNSSVGAVTFFEHAVPNPAGVVWTNVNVTSLHMNDSPDRESNDHPTLLTVTGGNLTCGMINWSGSHPSSRVVINGSQCAR